MAFALTKYRAYGLDISTNSRKRGLQVVELTVTAADTDTDFDIGDDSGTFWTAAAANATYGTAAAKALTHLQNVVANCEQLLAVKSAVLLNRVRVATATSGTEYDLAVSNSRPNINFVSGSAPTSIIVQLEYALLDSQYPTTADLG